MKKAIVFIDRIYVGRTPAMARYALSIGLEPYLVAPRNHTITDLEPFAEVITTDRWDKETLARLLDTIERKQPIAAVSTREPVFTADSLLGAVVAELAEERKLPAQNPAAYWRSINKYLTRDALRSAGVRTVDFGMATSEEVAVEHAKRIGYPVILKPVNGASSHLIMKCRDEGELREKFRVGLVKLPSGFHSKDLNFYDLAHEYKDSKGKLVRFEPLKSFLIEEYIPGREASVECVAIGNTPYALVVHDKVGIREREQTVFEDTLVTPPVRFSEKEIQEMKEYAVAALKAVGLRNSFAHVELRYEDGVGPQLLEINPRLGGAYIASSVQTNAGIDPAASQVQLALGNFVLPPKPEADGSVYGGLAFFPTGTGRLEITGLKEVAAIPGVLSATQEIPSGSMITGDEEECFAVVCWVKGKSFEDVMKTYHQARELIQMKVA